MYRKFFFTAALLSSLALVGVASLSTAAANTMSRPMVNPMVRLNVELDREVLPSDRAQRAVVKISLNPERIHNPDLRPPVNVSLVIDVSGSMSGSKITKAREAALEAIRRLDPRDVFSVVTYANQVRTIVPARYAVNTQDAEYAVRSIHPGGGTALFGGVSQGAAEVRRNLGSNFVHRIILLSDGIANVGPSSPSDLGRLGAALMKENISVTTIGIGDGFNEDLMTRLAEYSDGNHYFVESSVDLPRIFATELGEVQNVVARSIIIELFCEEGVRPVRIIGRDGRINGNQVEIRLNQLYGGQEKYALVEVEIPAMPHNSKRKLVQARLRYKNALNGVEERSQSDGRATFSRSDDEVKKSANIAVQKALTVNEMAEARDRALTLYNQGKTAPAAAAMRQAKEEIQKRNVELGFSDLAADADVMEEEADTFERKDMKPAEKKKLRSKSYRVRKQMPDYNSK